MRRHTILGACALAALAAGCSKAPERSEYAPSREMEPGAPAPAARDAAGVAPTAPDIALTAAPGVAFTYRYGFALPFEALDRVQETHAQACETLGPARCRITGLRYTLTGERSAEGQLQFKLAPDLARAFGKRGIAAVTAADGTLTNAEISGTDAGAAIDAAGKARQRAEAEVRRIDGELARARTAAERAELQRQRAAALAQGQAADDSAADERESLAQTPMTFDYSSGPAIHGFDATAPVRSAADLFVNSAQLTLTFVLGALALFLPPALVALLVWLAWRRWRPLRRRGTVAAATPPAA
jgi:hypothetical protein